VNPSSFWLFVVATLLVCLSPGPVVMLQLSMGLRQGFGAAWRSAFGVAAATLVYLGISVAGVLTIVVASRPLFTLIRYAGAGYLLLIGVQTLRAAFKITVAPAAQAAATRAPPFTQGFVTQISNPKAVLYWSALLPQFIDPRSRVAPQIAGLGITGIAIDLVVLTGYGALAASTRRAALATGFERWLDIVAGSFFIVTGVALAVTAFNGSVRA
jgi:homoserine/homoserine lactone efflux protein